MQMPADAYEPPNEVRDRFAILRDAGWKWLPTVAKGVAYNPTTREQITYDELRTMTAPEVAAHVKRLTPP